MINKPLIKLVHPFSFVQCPVPSLIFIPDSNGDSPCGNFVCCVKQSCVVYVPFAITTLVGLPCTTQSREGPFPRSIGSLFGDKGSRSSLGSHPHVWSSLFWFPNSFFSMYFFTPVKGISLPLPSF